MTETILQPESRVMPAEVRRATGILWLTLLLGVIASIIDWRRLYQKDPAFTVIVQVFSIAFVALLIWKMSQGRNWARVTRILLFVGGCLLIPLLSLFSATYRAGVFGSPFSTTVVVVQTAIQCYAFLLLVSSNGRTWFTRKQ